MSELCWHFRSNTKVVLGISGDKGRNSETIRVAWLNKFIGTCTQSHPGLDPGYPFTC